MSERFFLPHPITTEHVTLGGPEAHHLLHVMRAAVDTAITLFDNSGAEFAAIVETPCRTEVVVRIVERREADRELPFHLTVGVALPKGDRQKWLVEKLTELGVTTLVPLITERGVAQPNSSAIGRLSRTVIEAAKQCGRNRLMHVAEPREWNAWTETAGCLESRVSQPPAAIRRLFAHPSGIPFREIDLREPLPTALAIGPEGGLTDGEVAAALEAGWQQVSLGSRILRVETAAIALAAVVAIATER